MSERIFDSSKDILRFLILFSALTYFSIWCSGVIADRRSSTSVDPWVLYTECACVVFPLVIVSERLAPLRFMNLDQWIYVFRPSSRLPGISWINCIQVACFFWLGFIIGGILSLSFALSIFVGLLLAVLRFLLGFQIHDDPASLLRRGRVTDTITISSSVLDSRFSSDLLRICWMSGRVNSRLRPFRPIPLYLVCARLSRTPFAILLYISAFSAASVLSLFFERLAYAVGGIAICLCVSSVIRSCSFERSPGYARLPRAYFIKFLVGVVLSGLGPLGWFLTNGQGFPFVLCPLLALFIFLGALKRSSDRMYQSFTLIDPGIGVLFPLEPMLYWCAGWQYFIAIVGVSLFI